MNRRINQSGRRFAEKPEVKADSQGRLAPKTAFTLVELLVVIAIIGVLVALLLPAVQAAREAARRMSCSNNVKQLGLAMHNYHDAHRTLPYAAWGFTRGGWVRMTLPFIEDGNLAARWDDTKLYDQSPNLEICRTSIPVHICPSDVVQKLSWSGNDAAMSGFNYAVNLGRTTVTRTSPLNGVTFEGAPFYNELSNAVTARVPSTRFSAITDGLSHTLLIAEVRQGQAHTDSVNCDLRGLTWFGWHSGITTHESPNTTVPDRISSIFCPQPAQATAIGMPCEAETSAGTKNLFSRSVHPGGVHVALCDGSVHFISDDIDLATWRNLGSSKDGQVLGQF